MLQILSLLKHNQELTTFYIITGLLSLAANICVTVSVAIDCRINHIKHRVIWPLIVFVTYYGTFLYFLFRSKLKQEVPVVCTSCGKKAPKNGRECKHCGGMNFAPKTYENREKLNTVVIGLIVSSIVLFVGNTMFSNYSPMAQQAQEAEDSFDKYDVIYELMNNHNDFRYGYEVDGELVYYDAKGNVYYDAYDVVLYAEDGTTYTYDEHFGYVDTENRDNSISEEAALVDSDGYLVNAFVKFEEIPDITPFKVKGDKMYYAAEDISWNSDGKMVHTSNGEGIDN